MSFLIFYLFLILTILLILYLFLNRENYDYEKEYAYAQKKGPVVAGTVYTSYPGDVPGLGWVL